DANEGEHREDEPLPAAGPLDHDPPSQAPGDENAHPHPDRETEAAHPGRQSAREQRQYRCRESGGSHAGDEPERNAHRFFTRLPPPPTPIPPAIPTILWR